MNIKANILKNYSKEGSRKIASFVGNDPERFEELMTLFLRGPYRLTQRATIPVELCLKNDKSLIVPYFPLLISILKDPSSSESTLRNIMRTLQFVDIPRKYQGRILEICLNFLGQDHSPIAIKVFSMTVAAGIASHLPDVKKELIFLIEERLPYESAGFVSRGKKILNYLSSS